MIPDRYPAPYANVVFSDQNKYNRWTYVTRIYAEHQIDRSDDIQPVRELLKTALLIADPPTVAEVEEAERTTGHDVVAFLQAFTAPLPKDLLPFIHRGLTSSDLVDNAHFMALADHAGYLCAMLEDLRRATARWEGMITVRAGRTHGQIADLTTWTHQMRVHHDVLDQIQAAMYDESNSKVWKSPGPTGHSPLLFADANQIAFQQNATLVQSTQVIPRDYQLRWASVYLRLACELDSIATLIRCGARSDVGEVREGDWKRRVGSSSMPTKRNPIDCEKVSGLARVARGHFATLAENVALWDDRDISNSSVERIAVPGLASTVEHMLFTITQVVANLEVDHGKMTENARRTATHTYLLQALAQKHFKIGPVEAGALVRKYVLIDYDVIDGFRLVQAGYDKEAVKAWEAEVNAVWEGCFG